MQAPTEFDRAAIWLQWYGRPEITACTTLKYRSQLAPRSSACLDQNVTYQAQKSPYSVLARHTIPSQQSTAHLQLIHLQQQPLRHSYPSLLHGQSEATMLRPAFIWRFHPLLSPWKVLLHSFPILQRLSFEEQRRTLLTRLKRTLERIRLKLPSENLPVFATVRQLDSMHFLTSYFQRFHHHQTLLWEYHRMPCLSNQY